MLAAALVVGVMAAITLFRLPRLTAADGWAAGHGFLLDDRTRPIVGRYLRGAALLRRLGVQAGIWLPIAVVALVGGSGQPEAFWIYVFLGYLLGTIVAEVALVRWRVEGPRVAVLERREVADYVSSIQRVALRALAAGLLVAVVAVLVVRFRDDQGFLRSRGAAVGGAGLAFALALEQVQRWLVRRPQPFDDPYLVAADDALRTHALRTVAGAGLAVLCVALGQVLWVLAGSDVQVLRWALWVPALLLHAAAFGVGLQAEGGPWLVRRRQVPA